MVVMETQEELEGEEGEGYTYNVLMHKIFKTK